MKQNIINNRNIKIEEFYEKRYKPSTQIKAVLLKLFNMFYVDFEKKIDLKSIFWSRNQLELMLNDKETWEVLQVRLKDNTLENKCNWRLCTDNLCTWVHHNLNNQYFIKFLWYLKVKWKDLRISTFLNILANDPKAKKEYYQTFAKPDRPPFSVIQNWAHPLQQFRFFVNEGYIRNTDQSINLNLPKISIHHSERECQWISPNNKDKWYHFFNFPKWYYDNYYFDKYYYLSKEEKSKYIDSNKNEWNSMWLSTDLDENDVVMWEWTNKLSRAIDYAIENIEKNNIKILSFNCCCVPRIVWDDIYSVLERAKKRINIPFIFKWQLEKTPYEQKVMMLENYISKLDLSNIKVKEKSISLFWFHESFFQKKLWDILIENWIKINTSFIPTIDIRILELMFKSELFVFSPNKLQREAFEYPFQDMGVRYISPKYPYWVENSINWLKSIWKQFQIDINIWQESEKIIDNFNKKVEYVKEKGVSIWLVFLWLREVKKFFSVDYTNNVDVIEFLEEMGFNIKFFIYDNFDWFITDWDDSFSLIDWNHNAISEFINNKIKNKEKTEINFFWNKEEFDFKLKNSNLDLIYSDIFFDRRISDLWLNQFSLKNFYVWFEWALKTIEELINLSNMWFYKKYSNYFKK